MDLLVQITSAHRINPGGHVIQVMNDRSDDFLYYKPSTPIGKAYMTHDAGQDTSMWSTSWVRRKSIWEKGRRVERVEPWMVVWIPV